MAGRDVRGMGGSESSPQRGFTLLEVLAALGVFAVVTLGVVPLLGSALRASSTARSETIAEEASRNIMERIQGEKWYVSYDAKPNKRVDILDLYYPQASSNAAMGQSYDGAAANPPLTGTGGVFTTTCAPPPTTTNPACNFDVPSGYTVTITASFIKKVTTTTPETYQIVTPSGTYAWNSQGNDGPPASLMDLNVVVGWNQQGHARSISLRAIVGDRKFVAPAAVDVGPSPSPSATSATTGVVRLSGRATIDYVTRVDTGYSVGTAQPANGCPAAPCKSDATMIFGESESRIDSEDVGVTADETDQVADFSIARAYPTTQAPPPTPPPDLASVNKSVSVKHAPPYSLTTTDALDPNITYLTHPELANAQQAMIYGGENHNLKVDIASELPQAEGFFQTYGTVNSVQEGWFSNSQIDWTNMHLDSTNPFGYFQRALPDRFGDWTKANSYALSSPSRSVETQSSAGFAYMNVGRFSGSSKAVWNMFSMTNFAATTDCKSTANPATASATATWTFNVSGYYDNANNGTIPTAGTLWTATINSSGTDTFNGASVADALASLKALNPLEYDSTTNANDIYLFQKRDATGAITQKGYFEDIVPQKNPPTSVSPDGRTTSASIDGALRFDTAALSSTVPETAMDISVAKTSCEAVDNR